jgi:type I restriction enzyme S subunit
VDWFGQIPSGWSVKAIKYGFALIGSGTTPPSSDARYYSGTIPWINTSELRENIIDEFQSFVTEEALRDFSALRIYPVGTVLFAMYGATIGRVAILGRPATVNQAVCALANPTVLDARFTFYCLQASRDVLNALASGGGQPNLNAEKVREHRVPCPDSGAQRAIASFLDRETMRLDALVAAKQRVLDLLAEKRRAIIATAVRRGLDPKVKLRDSGVPWLGEIPAHWRSTRVGRLFRQSKMLGFPDLTVLSVYREFGVIERASRDDNANRVPDDLSKYQLVEVGDLVINKMKAWQGSLGVSDFRGITSPDYVVFRPIHSEDTRFLHSMLRMPQLTTVYLSISNGIRINQWRIEPERFANVEVFLPSLEEQAAIVDHIARETAKIDAVRAATERTIALLKERRAALIAAAVTGQIQALQ